MKFTAAMAALCLSVAGCATPESSIQGGEIVAGMYANPIDAKDGRLYLDCTTQSAAPPKCSLISQNAGRPPDRQSVGSFTNQASYLRDLVKEAARTAQSSGRTADGMLQDQDKLLLAFIDKSQSSCFGAREMGDLLVACPIQKAKDFTIVLFIRGLCDQCRFEPTVLRKIN